MTKPLTELDTVYAEVFKNMTTDERKDYCLSLIESTQSFLTKNNEFLNETIKEKSNDIIVAAQTELKELSKPNKGKKNN